MAYLYLLLAIVSEVVGTTALKISDGFSKPVPGAIVVVAYASAFFFLSLVLKAFPVGVVYAIWSGAGIVLISLIGYVWFRQSLDPPALAGMALIVAGILVMNLFSKSMQH